MLRSFLLVDFKGGEGISSPPFTVFAYPKILALPP